MLVRLINLALTEREVAQEVVCLRQTSRTAALFEQGKRLGKPPRRLSEIALPQSSLPETR